MSGYKKISEYGVIGNTHTAALISNEASVDWLCLPRFDAPSAFASILDRQKGGLFQIRPTSKYTSSFEYQKDTNILVTTFETEEGQAKIIDFMPVHIDEGGEFHVHDELHRIIEVVSGTMEMKVIFEPQLNYARGKTKIEETPDGLLVSNGSDKLFLSTSNTAKRLFLEKGQRATFVLAWNSKPKTINQFVSGKRLAETTKYWRGVVSKIKYSGEWKEEVKRSFLILHLLFYSPSGALVAAATTSIPEKIGGPRNWDYRYSWIRDASLTLQALFAVGDYTEALEYFSWLADTCVECGITLEVLYGVSKDSYLDEKELDHFEGYRKSSPVRIGNAAVKQLQLDIFGEVLDAAYIFHREGGEITSHIWKLLESLVDATCKNWHRPDQGFWEYRSGPYHFLSSKLFSWVALDRGIKIAQERKFSSQKLENWNKVRKEIKSEILSKGFNKNRRTFTQHYETEALDATALLMPLVGFIKVSDPKMLSTINAILEKLVENNFLHRYLPEETSDGISGGEGVFLAVNFWLIQNLILLNRIDDAKKMFRRILKTASPLGIFSEMVGPKTGEMLGNLPQALTHIEIILTAYYLDGLKEI